MATARFLERVVATAPAAAPPGRRLVDVDLRRGRVRLRGARHAVAPGPRPEEQLLAREWEPACPVLRQRAAARSPTSEAKPLHPDLDLRDQQARPRGDGPRHRRGLRDPDGRPALLQRLRRRARRSPTRTPASRRSSRRACSTAARRSIFEDGEQSRDFIHVSDIVQGILLRARVRAAPSATRSTSAPAVRPRSRRSPRCSRPGSALEIEPDAQRAVPRRRHPPLLRGPDPRRASCSASRPTSPSRTAWASSSSGSQDQEASRPGRRRHPGAGRARPGPLRQPSDHRDRTHQDQADLAIIIVSTNEANWLEPCLSTVFAARRRRLARRRRRRQRVHRRHARARRVEVPGGARRRLAEPRLRPRQQPRRRDVHGALRPLPQPRHRDRRRDLRRAGRGARRAARRRAGRGPAAHRRRHAVADDPLLPQRPPRSRRGASPPSAGRVRPRWAGERELDLDHLRDARSSATGPRARSCSAGARRC